jgi:hypothetical protein
MVLRLHSVLLERNQKKTHCFDGFFADSCLWFDYAKARGTALKVTDTISPAFSLPTMDEDIFSPQAQVPRTSELSFITGSDDASHMYLDVEHISGGVHTPQTEASKWLPLREGQVLAFEALCGYPGGAFQMQLSWHLRITGGATVKPQHSIQALLL